ncbi:MAG: efflux RND transporter periplasmic adaptor subunit [Proteobacteria bacterium]|nr:efflux RND transporter periplasmic adaptor subunit [Pseudomonadota bacterium]
MVKRFLIAGVLLVVVFGGLIGFNLFRDQAIKKAFSSGQIPPVTVATDKATEESWPRRVGAVGSLQAIQTVDVAPQVSGLVSEIGFEAGQRVKKGDILVRLDDAVERADLKRLEATRRLAQLTYDRNVQLGQRQYSPQSSIDQAQATLEQTDADIARTKALIDQKVIRAPFAGMLGLRQVSLGQYVGPGSKLVGLEALDNLFTNMTLPQQSLAEIGVGQSVSVTVDAFKDKAFAGRVTAIDPRLDQVNRMVTVQATIANPDQLLRPGMFISGEIVLGAVDRLTTVPRMAVDYSLYGDSIYVVVPGGQGAEGKPVLKVERRSVQLGDQRGDRVAVLKGLVTGEEVVVAGQIKLQNGFTVVIDNSIKLSSAPGQAAN